MGSDPTETPITRRRLLQSTAAGAAGLVAGCSGDGGTNAGAGGSDDENPGTTTQTPTATAMVDEIPYDTAVDHDIESWDRYDPEWEPPTTAPTKSLSYEVVAEGLEIPWDLSFTADGTLFVTERTGRITTHESGELRTVGEPSSVIEAESIEPGSDEGSWHVPGGEGGLLGITAHPGYPDPPLVYAYYTYDSGTDAGRLNRVVAYDTSRSDPVEVAYPIVSGIPAGTYHNGGRIAFGPENYLWITTGDADAGMKTTERTRDPGSLAGKVLRVEPDGSAPDSNPDIDGGDSRVYTYGHRNPQGITWLPDGTPVITEHGPSAGDEINVLRAGADYGWPVARNSGDHESYADTDFQPPVANAGSWAPCGGVFYTGDAVPGLAGRFLFGGLISQQITAATITPADGPDLSPDHDTVHDADWMDADYRAGTSALLPDELGRVRHVEQSPDGDLYAITSNRDGRASGDFPTERDDRLVRLRPE